MKTVSTILVALTFSVATVSAIAADAEALEAAFKKLDTNTDGSISLEEFKNSPEGIKDAAKAEEKFKKLDTDSDGSLSLAEFKAQ